MNKKTVLIILSAALAIALVTAAAVKNKLRLSECLAENYRLVNENIDLATENMLLSDTVNCQPSTDNSEKCLE